MKKRKILELDSSFTDGNWDGNTEDNVVILEANDPQKGREVSTSIETWLNSLGLRGATAEESEIYHQNLVGIEGWKIDFINRTYTRLDDFAIKWLTNDEMARIATPSQVHKMFTMNIGAIKAKRYGV